ELAVRGAFDVQVEGEHAAEHDRAHRLDHRAAPRAGLEGDEAVELEHAEGFAQRATPDAVLRHHLGLGREAVAGRQPADTDVVDDRLRDDLGFLRHSDTLPGSIACAPEVAMSDDRPQLGAGIIALHDPHRGHEHDFNVWYEADHMLAAGTMAPWTIAGAR